MTDVSWKLEASAYHRPEPDVDNTLIEVERGTPTGEMLRRYWHPIAVAGEVGDLPEAVTVLGERLVLFRTPSGKFGLMYPRCIHRGTELIYGRVEERGIRCCYHGWLFDPQGHCVERPCEPADSQTPPAHYRQPWYPVEERYGLVFAYLGPPVKQPLLPSYDVLENVEDGYEIVADGTSIGSGGPEMMPCNWFQTHENVMDPLHVYVLHSSFSTQQFGTLMAQKPEISFETTERGVISHQYRTVDDGRMLDRVTEVIQPNLRIVADPRLQRFGKTDNISWTLPIDRTNTKIFTAMKWPVGAERPWVGGSPMYGGKTWFELDEEGHQRFPGDYEAQVSQGEVTLHSEEHLATSDRGLVMFRRQFKQLVEDVANGDDAIGVVFDGNPEVKVRAGNFLPGA
ncbi:MAG: Rieske 2Fe-2S domain-containing protein [Pseudomonadota bacterium]